MTVSRILVVAGDVVAAREIEAGLIRLGFEWVGCAGSAASALAQVERDVPDLVVLGTQLGGGAEAVAAAHEIRRRWRTPVLLVGEEVPEAWWGKSGVGDLDGYLGRPFGDRQLRVALEIAVGRHREEESLRSSEAKYRTLVENAGEAVLVAQDGRLVFVNAKGGQMAGEPVAQMLGRSFADFVHPADQALVFERYRQRQQGLAVPSQYTLRLVSAGGATFWGELNVVPIVWNGKPATLNLLSDISERRRVEDERRQLQEQLAQVRKMESVGRLAGGVAHDFNNMLGVILGHAELALQQMEPGQPVASSLRSIRDAAQRSAVLTRQLLVFARQQPVAPRQIDLNRTVAEMLELLERLIGEQIELVWEPGPDLAPVLIDPTQLQQVVTNLCLNARDAMGGVGRVTIETRSVTVGEGGRDGPAGAAPGAYVLLAVTDQGSGMSEEVRAHLFEPFFTTKPVGKGTGLGLATVYGVVQQHHGYVDAMSQVGSGSTFRVFLPAPPAGTAVPEVEATPPSPAAAEGRETILVVEDEPAVLRLAERVLGGLGYRVLGAETPGAAIKLAEQHAGEIQLLVADVVLPEMSGRDLADRLAALQPGLRCLYMSGYAADVVGQGGEGDRTVHFIGKPFSVVELAAKVRAVLGGSGGQVRPRPRAA
jgi:PAS domain S-box-containing protein